MLTKSGKRSVKCFVINKTLEVDHPKLLLYLKDIRNPKTGDPITYGGYWDLFGGSKEGGETDLQSIVRELGEEIPSSHPLYNLAYVGELGPTKEEDIDPLAMFRVEIDTPSSKISCEEGRGIAYFEFNELNELKFPPFFMRFFSKNKEKILNYSGRKNIVVLPSTSDLNTDSKNINYKDRILYFI